MCPAFDFILESRRRNLQPGGGGGWGGYVSNQRFPRPPRLLLTPEEWKALFARGRDGSLTLYYAEAASVARGHCELSCEPIDFYRFFGRKHQQDERVAPMLRSSGEAVAGEESKRHDCDYHNSKDYRVQNSHSLWFTSRNKKTTLENNLLSLQYFNQCLQNN